MTFDHEKLDVYRVSIEFVTWSFELCQRLSGAHRHARDRLLRSSQSVPQNIAEGNGKRSLADRQRLFEIARGSAIESAASLHILMAGGALAVEKAGKVFWRRTVSMLTRLTDRATHVREDGALYEIEYGHDR